MIWKRMSFLKAAWLTITTTLHRRRIRRKGYLIAGAGGGLRVRRVCR